MNNVLRIQGKTFLYIPEGMEPGGWKWLIQLMDEHEKFRIISTDVFDSRQDAKTNMETQVEYLEQRLPELLGTVIDRKLDVINGGLDS